MADAGTNPIPAPGSDDAIALGCTCPVLDNAHGRGYQGVPGDFVFAAGCSVHARRRRPINATERRP